MSMFDFKKYNPLSKEVVKVSEIKDFTGDIKFKIIFSNFKFFGDQNDSSDAYYTWLLDQTWHDDREYQVVVLSFCVRDNDNPIIIIAKDFFGYNEALAEYYRCCGVYKNLVAAETRGWQDIRLFDEQIHCHKIDPNCCANCKFSRKDHLPFAYEKNTPDLKPKQQFYFKGNECIDYPRFSKKPKDDDLVCTNPDIVTTYKTINQDYPHWHPDRDNIELEFAMCPRTFKDFICDKYERLK